MGNQKDGMFQRSNSRDDRNNNNNNMNNNNNSNVIKKHLSNNNNDVGTHCHSPDSVLHEKKLFDYTSSNPEEATCCIAKTNSSSTGFSRQGSSPAGRNKCGDWYSMSQDNLGTSCGSSSKLQKTAGNNTTRCTSNEEEGGNINAF